VVGAGRARRAGAEFGRQLVLQRRELVPDIVVQ
jgi:hypothetical protein